jgi:hypothetical protein
MKAHMPIYRTDLVHLVSEGTSLGEIVKYFGTRWHLSTAETYRLFRSVGLMSTVPSDNDISENRRRQLQDLSLT